jgi:hypothetical protein
MTWVLCSDHFGGCLPQEFYSEKAPALPKFDLKSGKGEGIRLSIRLDPKAGCFLGALDELDMDLDLSQKKNIILSLENIIPGDKSFKPLTKSVTFDQLSQGVSLEFSLPKIDDFAHLGLFICRDSSERHRCVGKQALGPSEAIVENIRADKKIAHSPSDRIYFFQYLLIEKGGSLYLPTPKFWDEAQIKEAWAPLLAKIPAKQSQGGVTGGLFYSLQLNQLLQPPSSATFAPSSGDIQVRLGKHLRGCSK